jgi:hypothetical protein
MKHNDPMEDVSKIQDKSKGREKRVEKEKNKILVRVSRPES